MHRSKVHKIFFNKIIDINLTAKERNAYEVKGTFSTLNILEQK